MKIIVLRTSRWSRIDLVLHVPADQRVERAERLVEQHDLRIGGEGSGEPHALLHPSRQLVRVVLAPAAEADDLEHLGRLALAVLALHPLHLEAEGDVVDDPAMREQPEVLEHHADLASPDLAESLRHRS